MAGINGDPLDNCREFVGWQLLWWKNRKTCLCVLFILKFYLADFLLLIFLDYLFDNSSTIFYLLSAFLNLKKKWCELLNLPDQTFFVGYGYIFNEFCFRSIATELSTISVLSQAHNDSLVIFCGCSVLVHSGGVHGGHYYAFIRPTLSDQWYVADDIC